MVGNVVVAMGGRVAAISEDGSGVAGIGSEISGSAIVVAGRGEGRGVEDDERAVEGDAGTASACSDVIVTNAVGVNAGKRVSMTIRCGLASESRLRKLQANSPMENKDITQRGNFGKRSKNLH